MKIDEIKLMYEYNYWANRRILTACANVSQEQYIASTSFGNLRAALIHILDSEWEWRNAFQRYFMAIDTVKADLPAQAHKWEHQQLTEADLATLDALKERWQTEERAMRLYLDSTSEQYLNGLVRYLIPGGILRERVLWHCLVHVVNHGTQHRSEAAALLTNYGHSPGDMDYTVFLNEYFNLPS